MAARAFDAGPSGPLPRLSEHEPGELHRQTLRSASRSSLSLRPSSRVSVPAQREGAIPEPRVSMLVVRRVLEAFQASGLPRKELLQAAGIPEDALAEADTGVPRHAIEQMSEFAIARSADPALGLTWTQRLTVHTFAPISHTLMYTLSLRRAFELLVQYERLFCDQGIFLLEEEGERATLRMLDWGVRSPRVRRLMSEMAVAGFAAMLQKLQVPIERICFMHAAPDHHAEYTRALGSAVRFEQPFVGIVFARSALDHENPHSDGEVQAALSDVLERRLVRATEDAPYAMRVRELLVGQTPRRLDIATAARKLGLSERSLRRRLAAEGVSFREIQHSVLAAQAEELLQDRRFTIQEAAHAMGFSDASAFHRAFKRWTGTTPRAFGER